MSSMSYLLDSHTLLWSAFEKEKFPKNIQNIISNEDNTIYVSIASLWEIAIKVNLEKLSIPIQFFDNLEESGFNLLCIKTTHIKHFLELPLYHKDPFDRMLVAQTMSEYYTLITRDKILTKYKAPILLF